MLDKKGKIILGVIAVVLILLVGAAIGQGGNGGATKTTTLGNSKKTSTSNIKDNNTVTSTDKKLLKKSYKDFDVNERTEFAEIEQAKVSKLSSSEKADYDRLEKEKAEVEAEWQKEAAEQKQQQEAKNNKDFGAGEYIIGTHLDAGAYDITFNGSGNFTAHDSKGSLLINEIGGDSGVNKYRAIFTDGDKFKMEGMGIHTTPVDRTLRPYSNFSIYAGYWVVGQDITKGRYKVSTPSGSGNFVIYGSDTTAKTNEILGNGGVTDITVDLEDNDIIDISSLNQVNFDPAN